MTAWVFILPNNITNVNILRSTFELILSGPRVFRFYALCRVYDVDTEFGGAINVTPY